MKTARVKDRKIICKYKDLKVIIDGDNQVPELLRHTLINLTVKAEVDIMGSIDSNLVKIIKLLGAMGFKQERVHSSVEPICADCEYNGCTLDESPYIEEIPLINNETLTLYSCYAYKEAE